MRNKIGPNKATWGKPDNKEVQDEWCPPRDDDLVSIGKKASKPRQEWTLDTFACIFVKRRSCGTESKAFERSKKNNIGWQAFVGESVRRPHENSMAN